MHQAQGGGAYVQGVFQSKYSVISNNEVADNGSLSYESRGGGVFAESDVFVVGSSIIANRAEGTGGLFLVGGISKSAEVINSTVSGNISREDSGGGIRTTEPILISNSTIAFNRDFGVDHGGGIFLDSVNLDLQSSIVSDNVGLDGADDIAGAGLVNGSHDLIVSSTLAVPVDTRAGCPQLQPLAYNGGLTPNHALGEQSWALEWGSNPRSLVTDQRGAPRTVGMQPDSGAVERQAGETDERLLVSGFDGLCDQ
jgi:hypothetical protein